MNVNVVLTIVALALTAVSGVPGAFLAKTSRAGERIAFTLVALGSACGLAVAFHVALEGGTQLTSAPWDIPGGELALRLDPIAAIFLVQIFAIAPLASLYGIGYWPQAEHPKNGRKLRLFFGILIAGMALLVVAQNTVLFLLGWEGMALAAFLVVTTDDEDAAVRESGFVYLVATRIGTLALFAMFAVLRLGTGTWSFAIATPVTDAVATAVFVLGLIGCMLKAGIMPMHVWLPGAHANAPSHVSALMSGVLIKMGIYGLVRITSFFAHPPLWWGLALFALGVISGVLGVAFALGQHDLKRLLAYHSVENIGIILMGLGLAVIGRAIGEPHLVTLGLAGALLHVWNHGLFKALLFLSAGSVIHATHTREIDSLGGLAKTMPKTALAFLVGAIAICGLPPFNGFVSELFIYLGLFRALLSSSPEAALVGACGVPALALIGALALACFVKAFSAVFLGAPRSKATEHAKEAAGSMTAPMAALGGCCALIGLAPVLISPILQNATASWAPDMTSGPTAESLAPLRWLSVTSAVLLALVVALVLVLGRRKESPQVVTWDCGYAAPTPRMQYTSSSFAELLIGLFAWALQPRVRSVRLTTIFPAAQHFHSDVPDTVLDRAVLPATRLVGRALVWFRWIQAGNIQLYVLYVLAALVLTVLLFRR
jgi:hydrogenase-4 component B